MVNKLGRNLLLLFLHTAPLISIETTKVQAYGNCLILRDVSGRGGRSAFSFTNACNERLYINACLGDDFGPPKLYESKRAVPVGGTYTIYSLPGMRVNKVEWLVDRTPPGIPLLCQPRDNRERLQKSKY